jgi:hypothetical protein
MVPSSTRADGNGGPHTSTNASRKVFTFDQLVSDANNTKQAAAAAATAAAASSSTFHPLPVSSPAMHPPPLPMGVLQSSSLRNKPISAQLLALALHMVRLTSKLHVDEVRHMMLVNLRMRRRQWMQGYKDAQLRASQKNQKKSVHDNNSGGHQPQSKVFSAAEVLADVMGVTPQQIDSQLPNSKKTSAHGADGYGEDDYPRFEPLLHPFAMIELICACVRMKMIGIVPSLATTLQRKYEQSHPRAHEHQHHHHHHHNHRRGSKKCCQSRLLTSAHDVIGFEFSHVNALYLSSYLRREEARKRRGDKPSAGSRRGSAHEDHAAADANAAVGIPGATGAAAAAGAAGAGASSASGAPTPSATAAASTPSKNPSSASAPASGKSDSDSELVVVATNNLSPEEERARALQSALPFSVTAYLTPGFLPNRAGKQQPQQVAPADSASKAAPSPSAASAASGRSSREEGRWGADTSTRSQEHDMDDFGTMRAEKRGTRFFFDSRGAGGSLGR